MSKTEKLFRLQRFQDGGWSDVKAINEKGEQVVRTAKITPEQAEMNNLDSKTLGLKWVEANEVQEFDPETAKVSELDSFIASNKIEVSEGAKKDEKVKAVKEFIAK